MPPLLLFGNPLTTFREKDSKFVLILCHTYSGKFFHFAISLLYITLAPVLQREYWENKALPKNWMPLFLIYSKLRTTVY